MEGTDAIGFEGRQKSHWTHGSCPLLFAAESFNRHRLVYLRWLPVLGQILVSCC